MYVFIVINFNIKEKQVEIFPKFKEKKKTFGAIKPEGLNK
jgi:hypothetical protein